jgi:hypothetical protein
MKALGEIKGDKLRATRAYNKKVKKKLFQIGDLVWKMILSIRFKSNRFGKWSPNWEEPYRIEEEILKKNYMVQSVQGILLPKALNRKYLKMYYPTFGKTHELESDREQDYRP